VPLADSPPGGSARGLSRAQLLLLCVAYAALLAYLSFIPFLYTPLDFDEALRRFAQLPYLRLGAQSRADWVANLVMYLPLGWLLARLLQPAPRGRIEPAVLAAALLIGGAWAVAVEFAQLYFPNRTASLNDVLAEAFGTAAGALLWLRIGRRWQVWWAAIVHGGERTARAVLNAYVIAYLGLNLSPFDFVLSTGEFIDHLRSPLVAAWMAPVSCGPVPCSLRLLFEVGLAALLGLWWALQRRAAGIVEAVLAGLALGMLLEAIQLLLVSGVSQGASVLARGAGFVLGTVAYTQRTRLLALDRRRYGRPLVLALLLPYLWAVGFVNGWWHGEWIDAAVAWDRFGRMRWLPFHYHYFTTEQNAIRSGILYTLLYMPVGAAAWLWARRAEQASPAIAALLAALLAAVAELGKLFVPPRHPDMTDVLIAAVAAGATAALLRAIARPVAAVRARGAATATIAAATTAADGRVSTVAAAAADSRDLLPSAAASALPAAHAARTDLRAEGARHTGVAAAGTDAAPAAPPTTHAAPTGMPSAGALHAGTRAPGAGAGAGAWPTACAAPAGLSVGGVSRAAAGAEGALPSRQGAGTSSRATPPLAWQFFGALALAVAAVSVVGFPFAPAWLGAGLIAYALILARAPLVYLWVVPVALPLLDLAPWSGRVFWDEFDLLLLVTVGVRLLRPWPAAAGSVPDLPRAALGLLAASVLASIVVALLPLAPLDANAFTNYMSPYNALRLGKGYLWAVLLLWIAASDAAGGAAVGRRFAQGLALGLLALAAAVAWERAVFPGLFAVGIDFRVAGPVSAMHVGGAYLDALLVALLPFALLLALRAVNASARAAWGAIVLLGLYATAVTFSRATIVAAVVGLVVFAALWLRRSRLLSGARMRAGGGVAAAVLAGVALTMALAGGTPAANETMRDRFGASTADAGVRAAHWRTVLAMIRADPAHLLFGSGLGSFPREFYLRHGAEFGVAAYRIEQSPAGDRLVLYGGRGLFIVQQLGAAPATELDVEVTVRPVRGDAWLAVSVCEATPLYSAHCASEIARPAAEGGRTSLRLRVPAADGALAAYRPRVLSLSNPVPGAVARVEKVSVRDPRGAELLRNGDFAHRLDRWFFTSDHHLAWRAHNSLLQVLFEQGLLGLAAWASIVLVALRRLWLADARRGWVAAVGAAGTAVLLVSIFDALSDAPRLVVLALMLALFPGLPAQPSDRAPRRAAVHA
jgi:VanZ family protein